ncbi:retrotransposon protein, putative, ty1-copia subclass [Tanacetum coccineum]
MSPVEYRTILNYRLMILLFSGNAICLICRKGCLDSFGEHAVHYKELSGFKYRHDMVKDVLFDICRCARISTKKEAHVNFLTDPSDGRSTLRPANVLVFRWVGGKHACVDLTRVSPLVGLSSRDFTVGQTALKVVKVGTMQAEKALSMIKGVLDYSEYKDVDMVTEMLAKKVDNLTKDVEVEAKKDVMRLAKAQNIRTSETVYKAINVELSELDGYFRLRNLHGRLILMKKNKSDKNQRRLEENQTRLEEERIKGMKIDSLFKDTAHMTEEMKQIYSKRCQHVPNGPRGNRLLNETLLQAQPDNNNTLSSAFKTFFEREKLTGDNINDWYRSLRIVLRVAGTYDYLFKPCPAEPPEDAAENIKAAWKAEYKIHSDVAYLMLGRMSPALQRQFELYFPQTMLDELRIMFEKPPAVEIYDLVDTLHSCKQAPEKSVSAHVLEIKGYMDQLQALGKPYDNDMAINLINRSLNKDFGDFVRNFNMHCVGKTVSDLHALLIDYEKGLKDKAPTPQVLAIQKGRVNKPKPQANKKGKSKGKADKNKQVVAYQPKPKQNPPQKKENPKKDQACHYCNVVGHWKRNCPLYLEELRTNKNKKAEHGAATSGMDIQKESKKQTKPSKGWKRPSQVKV